MWIYLRDLNRIDLIRFHVLYVFPIYMHVGVEGVTHDEFVMDLTNMNKLCCWLWMIWIFFDVEEIRIMDDNLALQPSTCVGKISYDFWEGFCWKENGVLERVSVV